MGGEWWPVLISIFRWTSFDNKGRLALPPLFANLTVRWCCYLEPTSSDLFLSCLSTVFPECLSYFSSVW